MLTNKFMKNRNFWADLQYIGLLAGGVQAMNKTALYGGKASYQTSGQPLSGNVSLLVNCGGLTNGSLSKEVKQVFKETIFPALFGNHQLFHPKFTGKIILHFRDGFLMAIN